MVAGAFGARHHVVIHYVVTYCFFGFGLGMVYWLWPHHVLLVLAPIYIKTRVF